MSGHDPVARLIPWYAAGTLGPGESAEVEAHLASCEECRGLLALARGFRRMAPETHEADLFGHIQAQRLAEFAEDPSALEPDARRFITTHIRACAPCAEALEILEDLGSAPTIGAAEAPPDTSTGLLDRARQAWDDLWRRLCRTILRPGPAFAYLAALLVLLVALPFRTTSLGPGGDAPEPAPGDGAPAPIPAPAPGPRLAIRTLPAPIELPEEVVFRDGAEPPPPLQVPLPDDAGLLPIELRTSIERQDLKDATTRFRVRILQGDAVLFDQVMAGAAFDRRARLTLVLDPSEVNSGIPCKATIARVKPGDPGDDEELYRRSFVLVPTVVPPRESR